MIKQTHAERLVEQFQSQRDAQSQSADRHDLITLRMSLARLAQALYVQTVELPVLETHGYDDMVTLANQDKGWNILVLECIRALHDEKNVYAK